MRYESRNKKLNRQPGTVKNWIYRRGDIYLANLNPFKGSEQGGTRPVLVLSNDIGNFYSSLITIAGLSGTAPCNRQDADPEVSREDQQGSDVSRRRCCT